MSERRGLPNLKHVYCGKKRFFKKASKESDAAVKACLAMCSSKKNRSSSACSELILIKIENIGSVVLFLQNKNVVSNISSIVWINVAS